MVELYITNVLSLPDPKEYPQILTGLAEDRKEKILRFQKEMNRKQSLGASLLLKKCLEEKGFSFGDIYYEENGKPAIEGICFNLSHSEEMVICAISEQQVGCDIEKIENIREGIAKRYFTENENAYLQQFEGEKRCEQFYRLWTMKESYLKMTGEGLRISLNQIEFQLNEQVQVIRENQTCDCNIKEYELPGYKVTVCAMEEQFADKMIVISDR